MLNLFNYLILLFFTCIEINDKEELVHYDDQHNGMTYVLSFYKANCTNQPQPSSNDSPYYIATPSARKQHKLILLNILKKLLDSSFFSRPLSTMSIRVFAFFNYT